MSTRCVTGRTSRQNRRSLDPSWNPCGQRCLPNQLNPLDGLGFGHGHLHDRHLDHRFRQMGNPNPGHLSGGHCRPVRCGGHCRLAHPPEGPCLLAQLDLRALSPQGSRLCLDRVFRHHLEQEKLPGFLWEAKLLLLLWE